jgi:uncharacterized surface protein with fasciclin (FAS1) repeats
MKVRMFERLQQDPDFSTFVKGVEKAGLVDILSRSGLYTAFAPTNAAFDEFFRTSGYASLDAIPDSALRELVNYHFLVPMKFPSISREKSATRRGPSSTPTSTAPPTPLPSTTPT